MTEFAALVRAATGGHDPYPYQQRLADEGLPDLIRVPTGAGKTLAATLPWLYRRRFHPDPAVRAATPRRLVLVLPQRSLVEQTRDVVTDWLEALAENGDPATRLDPPVGVHVLLGGASTDDRAWKMTPEADAVLVGTQDMVLSRLLLRGYGEYLPAWPVAFGLLHADSQFVFDEVQLMGPGLLTSLQLSGLRQKLGVVAPCRTTWMSATVDQQSFAEAPDFPGVTSVIELSDSDRSGALARRLDATRSVVQLDTDLDAKRYPRSLAAEVLARHHPGTRTLVVLNTVDRAVQVHEALRRAAPAADLVLLHSRFRPGDRADRTRAATAEPAGAGVIVVSTQVLEAGVDISSRLLVTEVAPWSSVVQRAGRCNRGGEHDDAVLAWCVPPAGRDAAAPYEDKDLLRSAGALRDLDGVRVTSTTLQGRDVEQHRPLHPVLRRVDLLDLFDTAPDLTGNDLDVGRWIRDADTITVDVGWRDHGPGEAPGSWPTPTREELCPVPLSQLRDVLGRPGRRAWLYDRVDSAWRPAGRSDVRPGGVLVLDAQQGGYLAERGWAPDITAPVPAVLPAVEERPDGLGDDHLTIVERAVTLADHCEDVRWEVAGLIAALGPLPGLTAAQRAAAERAGLYHDLGKVHHVFAASLRAVGVPDGPGPWAKSSSAGRLRHERPAFRHELVSALMVLAPHSGLLDDVAEPDLVAYLVAAHHGKVRLAVRSAPGEDGLVLGVGPEESTDPVVLSDGHAVPPLTLNRAVLELGGCGEDGSWTARACRLRDRVDLGPFRLAFLEAVVRMADWRASASYRERAAVP